MNACGMNGTSYQYNKLLTLENTEAFPGDALYDAKCYAQNNNYQKSIERCLPLINENHNDAITLTMAMLENQPVSRELADVVAYCKYWAGENNPAALFVLGCIYSYGNESYRGLTQAIDYFDRAHKMGLAAATEQRDLIIRMCGEQNLLTKPVHLEQTNENVKKSSVHNANFPTKQNYFQVIENIKSTAKQGNVHAKFLLGRAYINGDYGVKKDIAKALKYLKEVVDTGHLGARSEILALCLGGCAFDVSPGFAFEFLADVIQHGSLEERFRAKAKYAEVACLYADKLLEKETRSKKNITQILYYYKKSDEYGNVKAPFMLAKLYEYGWDPSKTDLDINRYYERARERGYQALAEEQENFTNTTM